MTSLSHRVQSLGLNPPWRIFPAYRADLSPRCLLALCRMLTGLSRQAGSLRPDLVVLLPRLLPGVAGDLPREVVGEDGIQASPGLVELQLPA
jgi:hypothetical protein